MLFLFFLSVVATDRYRRFFAAAAAARVTVHRSSLMRREYSSSSSLHLGRHCRPGVHRRYLWCFVTRVHTGVTTTTTPPQLLFCRLLFIIIYYCRVLHGGRWCVCANHRNRDDGARFSENSLGKKTIFSEEIS